jgi:hypothetical protein
MRGLEVPEWGSTQNLLLVEWFERERSERASSLWCIAESIVISQMDPSISWADKMGYIQRAVDRYHSTLWQTKYSPTRILNKLRKRYAELKGDIDRLDNIAKWG